MEWSNALRSTQKTICTKPSWLYQSRLAAEVPKPKEPDDPKDKKYVEALQKYEANQKFAKKYQSAGGLFAVETLCRGLSSKNHEDLDRNVAFFHCANGVISLDALKHCPTTKSI